MRNRMPVYVVAAAALALAVPTALATKLSPMRISLEDPQGVLTAQRKLQCSLEEGKPITYWWRGDMYSRMEGERDRLLFKVEGMNTRRCVTVTDPVTFSEPAVYERYWLALGAAIERYNCQVY